MLTQIAAGVWTHESPLIQNNSIVVQGASGALLVDPGITVAEITELADDVRALGLPIVAAFSTHPDWDHALWHPVLGDAPRYGTPAAAAFLTDLRSKDDWRAQFAGSVPEEIADEIPVDLFGLIDGVSGIVPWDGPTVRIVEHPAHATGHAALVVEGARVLIAGDMLSDILMPFPDSGSATPLEDYLAGLDALEAIADSVDVVIPGHGSPSTEVRARIALDRAYVLALRDGTLPDDPRIQPGAAYGSDWVPGIYEWHKKQFGPK